ncbi:hypothetical protein SeLEV6574_g01513 [Synchytrium endobioticum]|uniref:Translation initiation factor 5A C-terminal domain-containing protein n=1 Tax=Synchytrium endobioticum TaxID=286115 RepID=A0A507DDH0_9FUNG|nr:hypothetical protein SeLEV6574_g01513 [Synchytrium endobioticum]
MSFEGSRVFDEVDTSSIHTTELFRQSMPSKSLLSSLLYGDDANMGDDEHHEEFESAGGSGASLTYPIQCSALRKNGFVVLKGRPCKIVDMSTSKTGKHGHAKVHLVGIDIFTNKKLEDLSPSTHNMDVPNVSRIEFQLLDIDDDFLSMMTPDGSTKDDVKVPEGDLGEQLKTAFAEGKELLVTVISAMGEEAAISFKEAPKGNN